MIDSESIPERIFLGITSVGTCTMVWSPHPAEGAIEYRRVTPKQKRARVIVCPKENGTRDEWIVYWLDAIFRGRCRPDLAITTAALDNQLRNLTGYKYIASLSKKISNYRQWLKAERGQTIARIEEVRDRVRIVSYYRTALEAN